MLNLATLLEMSTRRNPGKIAVILDDMKLRYAEVNGAANKIANGLGCEGREQNAIAVMTGRINQPIDVGIAAQYRPIVFCFRSQPGPSFLHHLLSQNWSNFNCSFKDRSDSVSRNSLVITNLLCCRASNEVVA